MFKWINKLRQYYNDSSQQQKINKQNDLNISVLLFTVHWAQMTLLSKIEQQAQDYSANG